MEVTTRAFELDCDPQYYDPSYCRAMSGGHSGRSKELVVRSQCGNRPGRGPDLAYCIVHDKKVKALIESQQNG